MFARTVNLVPRLTSLNNPVIDLSRVFSFLTCFLRNHLSYDVVHHFVWTQPQSSGLTSEAERAPSRVLSAANNLNAQEFREFQGGRE